MFIINMNVIHGNFVKTTRKFIIFFAAICCLVGCDVTSKKYAKNELKGEPIQSLLGGNLKLVFVENDGGILGLGSEMSEEIKRIIFVHFVSLILIALFVYIILKDSIGRLKTAAFILFISGGLGNLADRITNEGKVVDFIILEFTDLTTGVFNIADFYVFSGVVILILTTLFTKVPRNMPEEPSGN